MPTSAVQAMLSCFVTLGMVVIAPSANRPASMSTPRVLVMHLRQLNCQSGYLAWFAVVGDPNVAMPAAGK